MFDDLTGNIDAMFGQLSDGYEGKHQQVLDLIQAARVALTQENGELGPWEAHQLDYAESALKSNYLRLALGSTEKALVVSQLPRDEYDYGFNRPE